VFLFSSPTQWNILTVDESRIHTLDEGEGAVIVQTVANLREGERQEIGVFFADGRALTRAAFVLVRDPSEVDSRGEVQCPEPPDVACQLAAQTPVPMPEDFVLLGYVDSGQEGRHDNYRQKTCEMTYKASLATDRRLLGYGLNSGGREEIERSQPILLGTTRCPRQKPPSMKFRMGLSSQTYRSILE
jgi:hypothetical protein